VKVRQRTDDIAMASTREERGGGGGGGFASGEYDPLAADATAEQVRNA
jgi:hypothetical protein